MQRRSLLAGILGTVAAFGAGRRHAFAYADAVAPTLDEYAILIGGRESGRHSVKLDAEGAHCIATMRSTADVRMLVIPVFRYEHVSREVWRQRRLIGFESRTDDNGRSFRVAGRSTPSGFLVDVAGKLAMLPADVAPATYWNRAILERTHVLDPEDGRLFRQQVGGERDASLDWAPAIANVSEVDVTSIAAGVVWYGPSGRFLGCRFMKGGHQVEFRARSL